MVKHDIAPIIEGTEAKYQSEAEPTKDTPYPALTGKLWGVFCEYFGENWLRYSGTALQNPQQNKMHVSFQSVDVGIRVIYTTSDLNLDLSVVYQIRTLNPYQVYFQGKAWNFCGIPEQFYSLYFSLLPPDFISEVI